MSSFNNLTKQKFYPVPKINPNGPNQVIIDSFFVGHVKLPRNHDENSEAQLAAMLKTQATAQVFSIFLKAKAFQYLRTELTLGYIATALYEFMVDGIVVSVVLQGTEYPKMEQGVKDLYPRLREYLETEYQNEADGSKNLKLSNTISGLVSVLEQNYTFDMELSRYFDLEIRGLLDAESSTGQVSRYNKKLIKAL